MDDDYYDDDPTALPDVPRTPAFALTPLNTPARKAVEHARNNHLRCRVEDGTIGLWLDFSNPDKQACTLGCDPSADIHLPDARSSKRAAHISRIHASFQVVEETGAVLLWDHSENSTVEPLPNRHGYTVKIRSNAKSVLVAKGINTIIAFGAENWYQFEIQWRSDGLYRFPKDEPYHMGPRNSRLKKYIVGGEVGAGSYGTVLWVLDVTNGNIIAVKKFHKLSGKNLEFATREIANLFRINRDKSIKHDHILQILDSSGGGKGEDWGEIFMPLMQGNLKSLVERVGVTDLRGLSDLVLRQMLLALECVASHHIIHRDVKPENILWEYDETGNYRFCLGDFGLSNDPGLARTAAGTEPFMAPEVFHRKKQTTHVDIWSLFATIVWTRMGEFRRRCSNMRAPDLHQWLVSIAQMDEYANIRGMASINAADRPSAKRQLAILDGEYEDYNPVAAQTAGYSPSRDELGDGLSARFARMSMRGSPPKGAAYEVDGASEEAGMSPELPYYEPYASGIMESYFNQAGPSRRYMPPSPDPADAPRDHGAWDMYEKYENPYRNPDIPSGDSGSGTAVPDTWTTVAPTVENFDESAEEEVSRRRRKGKNRA
ncbi:hypothetical protein C8A05DRAFT_39616 [Staphylotrichum tortipilum]|uniref:non-specific serine/threonine protein kinase n=1 Tax=Staphylotrichum tortipilum TaxID=2831512 RepID=A0AAN6MAZ8_9PEZI|nr:hypothetical protein C8A05DRAFT_39616 [Staphylotrichum longicolle]